MRVHAAWSLWRWLLPLAFAHALLYMAIVPPWQHYDEPAHFEYARLIALWNRQPAPGETDLASSREIADSMYRFRFWPPAHRPDLLSPQAPAIGLDQKVHPPLYYAVAALPLRLTRHLSVEFQLYSARLVSVALYLLAVLGAWRISVVLAPGQPLVQAAAPLLLCLVPAFADIMTAVNNDVLVNFSAIALLLGCVLLIRDGIRPVPLTLAVLGLLVGLLTKRTAVVGVAPFLVALLWAFHRGPTRWWRWLLGVLFAGAVAGLAIFRLDSVAGPGYSSMMIAVRPWVDAFDRAYLRLDIDSTIRSLSNWQVTHYIYPHLFSASFTTFWQRFGWGHVVMHPAWELAMLGISVLGAAGLMIRAALARQTTVLWQKRCIWLFALTLSFACLALVLRVHPLPPPGGWVYIPVGRYAHLAMLPAVWLLQLGVRGLAPRRWRDHSLLVLVGFFVALDTAAWASTLIGFYYHP